MKYLVLIILIISFNLSFSKPQIIPEIREWESYDSTMTITDSFDIIYDVDKKAELEQLSQTFSEDVDSLKKWKLDILSDISSKPNNIYLKIDETISANDESYIINITDRIVITGKSAKAVFWGTRTILQMLKNSESIECGRIVDNPDYHERGLMIDLGRRYHTIQWLENHIRDLSYLKMNLFHFHLSDNEGFRLECETYPQITSKEFYTKQEMLDLQKLAKKYFVEIIPGIDMPNHMSSILKHFPNLWLVDKGGNPAGECCLDYTKDASRILVKNIINEYINLFDSKYWHLGADEFFIDYSIYPHIEEFAKNKYGQKAKAEDSFVDFINWVDSISNANNKTLRISNDFSNQRENKEFILQLNKDILIEYWSGDYPVQKLIDSGYTVMNCSEKYLYYVLANPYINNEYIYNDFKMLKISNYILDQFVTNPKNQISGSKFSIWNDVSGIATENEAQTANTVMKVIRILSQKTWLSNHTIDSFKNFNTLITKIGRAPGYIEPASPIPFNLAYKMPIYASSVEPKSEDLYPEMANDGDYTTRWASALTDKEWIYVDFGKKTKFTTVRLNWEYAYPTDYAIQISDDAINWTDIYFTDKGKGSFEIIDDLNSESRYLKVDCRKRVAWNGNSLWEFEVYDSNAITSVYNFPEDLDKMIYPNPAMDYITINLDRWSPHSKCATSEIEIYNVMGVLIQTTPSASQPPLPDGNLRIDISHFTLGVYFVKIVGSNGACSIVEKFVKM